MKSLAPGGLERLKEPYRTRFARDIPKLTRDVRPDQNAWDFIDECFQETDIADDFTFAPPVPRGFSTPKEPKWVSDAALSKKKSFLLQTVEETLLSGTAKPSTSVKETGREGKRGNNVSNIREPEAEPVTRQNPEDFAGGRDVAEVADKKVAETENAFSSESEPEVENYYVAEVLDIVLEADKEDNPQNNVVSFKRAQNSAFELEKSALQIPASPTVKLSTNKRLNFSTKETPTFEKPTISEFKKPDKPLTQKPELTSSDGKSKNPTSEKASHLVEKSKDLPTEKSLPLAGKSKDPPTGTFTHAVEKRESSLNVFNQTSATKTEMFKNPFRSFYRQPTHGSQMPPNWNTAPLPQEEAVETDMEEEFNIEETNSFTFKSWISIPSKKKKVPEESSHLPSKNKPQSTEREENIARTKKGKENAFDANTKKPPSEQPKKNKTFRINGERQENLQNEPAASAKEPKQKMQKNKAVKRGNSSSGLPQLNMLQKSLQLSSEDQQQSTEREESIARTEKGKRKLAFEVNTKRPSSEQPKSNETFSIDGESCEKLENEPAAIVTEPKRKMKRNKTAKSGSASSVLPRLKKKMKKRGSPKKKQVKKAAKRQTTPETADKTIYRSPMSPPPSMETEEAINIKERPNKEIQETNLAGSEVAQTAASQSRRVSRPPSKWWLGVPESTSQPSALSSSPEVPPQASVKPTLRSPKKKQVKKAAKKQITPEKVDKTIYRSPMSPPPPPSLETEEAINIEERPSKEIQEANLEGSNVAQRAASQSRRVSRPPSKWWLGVPESTNQPLALSSSPEVPLKASGKPTLRNPKKKQVKKAAKKQTTPEKADKTIYRSPTSPPPPPPPPVETEEAMNVEERSSKEIQETNLKGGDVAQGTASQSRRMSRPPSKWWLGVPERNSQPSALSSSPEVPHQASVKPALRMKKSKMGKKAPKRRVRKKADKAISNSPPSTPPPVETDEIVGVEERASKEGREMNQMDSGVAQIAARQSRRVSRLLSQWWIANPKNSSQPSAHSSSFEVPLQGSVKSTLSETKSRSMGRAQNARLSSHRTQNKCSSENLLSPSKSREAVAKGLGGPISDSNEDHTSGNIYCSSTEGTVPVSQQSTVRGQKLSFTQNNHCSSSTTPQTSNTVQSPLPKKKSAKKRSISNVAVDVEKSQESIPSKVKKSILRTGSQMFVQDSVRNSELCTVEEQEARKHDQSDKANILSSYKLKTAQPRRSRILSLLSHKSSEKGQHQNFRTSLAGFSAAYANTPETDKGVPSKSVVNVQHLSENVMMPGVLDKSPKDRLDKTPKQTQRMSPKCRHKVAESQGFLSLVDHIRTSQSLQSTVNNVISFNPGVKGLPESSSRTSTASFSAASAKSPFSVRGSSKNAVSPERISKGSSVNLGEKHPQQAEKTTPRRKVHHPRISAISEEQEAECPEDKSKRTEDLPTNTYIAEQKRQTHLKDRKKTNATSSRAEKDVYGIKDTEQSEGEGEESRVYVHESGPVPPRTVRFRNAQESPIAFQELSGIDDLVYENRPKLVLPSSTPNVRRSKRTRVIPLEYWRGERVDYKSRQSGGFVVGGILSPEKKKAPYVSETRDHRKRTNGEQNNIHELYDLPAPEPYQQTIVLDPDGNEVLLECLKTTSKCTVNTQSEALAIVKTLDHPTFTTGKLLLGPLKEKDYQHVCDNTIIFYISNGLLSVTLYRTTYNLNSGDFFFVPPGNCYSIKNLKNEDALLIYTQIKSWNMEEESQPQE